MHGAAGAEDSGPNPAGATLMLVVAFLSFNLSMGAMYGPFSVLISSIEAKLHVTREVSTLPIPVVTFVMSFLAPVVGTMLARFSLRLCMMVSAAMMAAGFMLASIADSLTLFMLAYGVLIAPGLCVCGAVAPSTLVARWFRSNRGRAMGIAATPALLALTPFPTLYILSHYGLTQVYWMFTGMMLLCLGATALVRDNPPAAPAAAETAASHAAGSDLSVSAILRDTRFWRLALAVGLYSAVIVMFSTQIVPFATGIGVDETRATGLLTIYLIGTLVGTPLVGAVADRIGGARMLTLLCVALGLWQALLITHPGYLGLAVLSGLAGLQGSAGIPSIGLALSRLFGPQHFSKALGISTVVGLPFGVACVPVSSWIFVRTHSYTGAFLLATTILAIGALLAVTVREGGTASSKS